jgi:GNAT superfamily N-acetyltransferase
MNWYNKSQQDDLKLLDLEDELNALLQRLRDEYPLSELEAWVPQGRYIDLARINVRPDSRGQGVGSAVMREIQDFAKLKGLPIRLSPEPDRGKKEALERF